MLDATYAFRFAGFAMSNGILPHYLVGVGSFTLRPDGRVFGRHHSSTTALKDDAMPAEQIQAVYALRGKYRLGGNHSGRVGIHFKLRWPKAKASVDAFDMFGAFRFTADATYDRLWLISTYGQDTTKFPLDEVVTGEAVRIRGTPGRLPAASPEARDAPQAPKGW